MVHLFYLDPIFGSINTGLGHFLSIFAILGSFFLLHYTAFYLCIILYWDGVTYLLSIPYLRLWFNFPERILNKWGQTQKTSDPMSPLSPDSSFMDNTVICCRWNAEFPRKSVFMFKVVLCALVAEFLFEYIG